MPTRTPPAIFCYSKSGHTRRAADALAERTGATVIPVEVDRYKVPLLWFFRAIWDVARAHLPPLRSNLPDVSHRPWIVVAFPVWADQPAAPARSVLTALAATSRPVGILATCGAASEQAKTMRTCDNILGRPAVARTSIQNKIEDTLEMEQRLNALAKDLLGFAAQGAA